MNGMDENSIIVAVTAWWQATLYTLDAISALVATACIVGLFLLERKEKRVLDLKSGLGFYVGCVGAVLAIVADIGCIMLGQMVPQPLFLVVNIALFGAAAMMKRQALMLLFYFCCLGAGCAFLPHQLYTVTNVIAGIDATGFETKFLVAAVGMMAAILVGMIATIPAFKKEEQKVA